MRKLQIVAALLLAVALVFSACARKEAAPTPAQAPAPASALSEWDKIVAAAKEEGRVVLYNSQGIDVQDAVVKGLLKDYGIKYKEIPLQKNFEIANNYKEKKEKEISLSEIQIQQFLFLMNPSFTFLCMRSFSAALQTLGLCVFALIIIFSAFS